ncbi:Gfo/Idh/MocA family oxidoreductase [Streptomyces sp. HD1123-B1]|uniref:Gfo/Idh/MocA family oxidoreductase n=1 Tax=Streptomyces huangiella TaxID=3228804 RepID=UPI003D7C5BEB
MPGRTHVCVVGYGVAGRLHHRLLESLGVTVSVVDAAARSLRRPGVRIAESVAELPAEPAVDLWSVCTPTADHLPTVAAVLARDPAARLLVEKPVCGSWEVPAFGALLREYPRARMVVMNQYQHAQAPALLKTVKQDVARHDPVSAVRIAFVKDRRADIAAGRFVDRDYGVFGYEWLHMLALLGTVLPRESFRSYLRTAPGPDTVRVAPDPELISTAAHDTVALDGFGAVELYSSIVGPDSEPWVPVPGWAARPGPAADDRLRLVQLDAGPARFTLELDPVSLPRGTALPRNTHRLTVDLRGRRQEWLVHDSPLENALRRAMTTLLADTSPPEYDFAPVRRIGQLAELARSAEPVHSVPADLPSPL